MIILILVATALSFGQATKTPPTPKPEIWERSKECAAQAEKVVIQRNLMTTPYGNPIAEWKNHYTPKYNRCYLWALYLDKDHIKSGQLTSTMLIDAFERSVLAESAGGVTSVAAACRNEAKSAECKEDARYIYKYSCTIEKEQVDCLKSEAFISEHMKN